MKDSKVSIYSSSTAAAVPTAGNLINDATGSELAINIADGKLFYKDNTGVVRVIADRTKQGTLAEQNANNVSITGGYIEDTEIRESAVDMSAISVIDLADQQVCFFKTLTGNVTFSVTNVPASGTVASFILELTNAGSHTITWWSGILWPKKTLPELTVSGSDRLGFYTRDGGTTWNAVEIALDIGVPV